MTAKRTTRKEAVKYQEESEEEITQPKSPKPTPKVVATATPAKVGTKRTNGKLIVPDSGSDQDVPEARATSPTPKKACKSYRDLDLLTLTF